MMRYQTVGLNDLEGWWLDYVIAGEVCEYGTNVSWRPGGYGADLTISVRKGPWKKFSPSTLWADAGPLIEEFRISLKHFDQGGWEASLESGESFTHHFPLIAAMKVLAMSKDKDGFQIQMYS
ncbi:DUF2591 family protein [Pseudomonas lurida]|uniref:phage protein NinX family protein n=1 Tax=Pseudomonas lurida TaxID=244566 RepID=UPI001786A725|nr:phage protein NinX family protein [Pseudomonas lurida]MBD8669826.1 DUF2591 family protein [Pseudomonas lurida]UZQ74180.1 DUF2591 family protein [Pseudomonas lurida]